MREVDRMRDELAVEPQAPRQRLGQTEPPETEEGADEVVRHSKAYLESIVQNVPDMLLTIASNGKISYANEALSRFSGLSLDQLVGKPVWPFLQRFFTPETAALVEQRVRKRLHTGEPVSDIELQVLDANGEAVPCIYSASGIRDSRGEVVGEVVLMKDIRDRKQMEDELRRHRDYLEQVVGERTAELRAANQQLRRELADRERMGEELRERAEFEKLVTTVSTKFINLPGHETDRWINYALGDVGSFIGADRAYVLLIEEGGARADNTHEWCADGIKPRRESLQGLTVDSFPWWAGYVNHWDVVQIPAVEQLPPEAEVERECLQSQGIRSLIMFPMVFDGELLGFLGFDSVREEKAWADSTVALLRIVADVIANAVVRNRSEEALRQSQEFSASLLANSPNPMLGISPDSSIRYVNPALEKLTGFSSAELVGKRIPYPWWTEETGHDIDRQVSDGVGLKGQRRFERIFRKKNGDRFWVETTSLSVVDDGESSYYLSSWVDITERKKMEAQIRGALKEKEVLLREIHHRVKNNMQVVSSLLSLQSRRIGDEQARRTIRDSQNRVRSMSLVHDRLYRSGDLARIDFEEYVRAVTTHLLSSHSVDPESVTVKIDMDGVLLNVDMAIPCGLIINELLSSVLEHGFPEGRNGEIRIGLHRTGEGQLTLSVGGNGVGLPVNAVGRDDGTLGLQLVTTLARQLGGVVTLNGEDGATFAMTFGEQAEILEEGENNGSCASTRG